MGGAPRIPGFSYVGRHAYFLTICTSNRVQWFLVDDIAPAAIGQLLHFAVVYGFDVVAYCVMPDHLHGLIEGTRSDSDFS